VNTRVVMIGSNYVRADDLYEFAYMVRVILLSNRLHEIKRRVKQSRKSSLCAVEVRFESKIFDRRTKLGDCV